MDSDSLCRDELVGCDFRHLAFELELRAFSGSLRWTDAMLIRVGSANPHDDAAAHSARHQIVGPRDRGVKCNFLRDAFQHSAVEITR